MIIAGAIIVIITFAAIIKNYETRTVLLVSGLIMAGIGGQPMKAIDAFLKQLVNPGLVPVIVTCMGFALIMDYTGCSKHLIVLAANVLKRVKFVIIPGTVLMTFLLGIALPSAAGLSATVGAIMIPLMLQQGIHPAMAASAVFLGTWGSVITPGNIFNIQVGQLAGVDPISIMIDYTPTVFAALFAAIALLTVWAIVRHEGAGSQPGVELGEGEDFKINPIKALMPILPVILIILCNEKVAVLPFKIKVEQAMLICTIISYLVYRKDVRGYANEFFKGMGNCYGSIIGIIAAAAAFTAGMQVIGLTGSMIDMMKNSQSVAQIGAGAGPFIIAVLCGSGNAATLAFNGAVTPHAVSMGFTIVDMGSVAQITGALGRCMSPVAGACLIAARIAGVNPMELAKRNALPTIVAAIIVTVFLM